MFIWIVEGLEEFEVIGKTGKIIRLVRIMRILRIFKLVRHFAGLQSLIITLQQVSQVLVLTNLTPIYQLNIRRIKSWASYSSSSWWQSSCTAASSTSPRGTGTRSSESTAPTGGRAPSSWDEHLIQQQYSDSDFSGPHKPHHPSLSHLDIHR